jgi:hypothetical protein
MIRLHKIVMKNIKGWHPIYISHYFYVENVTFCVQYLFLLVITYNTYFLIFIILQSSFFIKFGVLSPVVNNIIYNTFVYMFNVNWPCFITYIFRLFDMINSILLFWKQYKFKLRVARNVAHDTLQCSSTIHTIFIMYL